ncbi:hypothetical protein JCM3765_006195 [Sporobolomyces pararoseus]
MGLSGCQQAIDKQQAQNSKALEQIETRPPSLGTREEVRQLFDGELTEREERWRSELLSRKRKWDGETGAEDEPRIVEWSFKGRDFQDGVDHLYSELKPDDYVSLVVTDMSNILVSSFAKSDSQLKTQLTEDSSMTTRLLKERRFKELRACNMHFVLLRQAFPRAELIGVYDHHENRSVHKFVGASRVKLASVAQGSRSSRQAVQQFIKNDGTEGRKANLQRNGPPKIVMQDQVTLPAFAPPTQEDLEITAESDELDKKIAAEGRKLKDLATLVVSTGEADTICRDYPRLALTPQDPRISSISLSRPLEQPVVDSEEPSAWISQVEEIEKNHHGRKVIFATDSDHYALNDETTFDFWFSSTPSTCRVVNFRKRSLHPTDWAYSSFSSSAMAMVLAGCDLSTGTRGFTVHGIGTRKPASKLNNHQKQEVVLLDICENALEWRDAYNKLSSSSHTIAHVNIAGTSCSFDHIHQLAQKFDDILKPIYDSASTSSNDRQSLSQVLERFEVLYGESHDLRSKKDLQMPIDLRLEERTNAELKTRYATPGARNHLLPFLNGTPVAPSPSPPTAGRSRRSQSVPPAGNVRLLSASSSTTSSRSPPHQRTRRYSSSTVTRPLIVPHLPFQTRSGPTASTYLQHLYSTFAEWKEATSNSIDSKSGLEPPRKKARPVGRPKGKGKEKVSDEKGDGEEEEEEKKGETIARVKAVKGGARDFGMAVSTIPLPFRPSSFNDLLFPGLPPSQHFHHTLHGTLLDLLNLWLNECPGIVDNVQLLLVLYSRFSPSSLARMINRGGQKFGDSVATLVQRGAEYYQSFPLGTQPPSGPSSSLDSAPSWLKEKVEEVLDDIPVARRRAFWDLVDSLRFTENDAKILKKNKEFNIFGMIVVKLRRLHNFPPPLLRHNDFITRNFTVCGTSLFNAALFRGQRIHRSAALVIVDRTLDFAAASVLNPQQLDSSRLSTALSSLSSTSKLLLSTVPSKRLKRLVCLHIWKSPLPDATNVTNRFVQSSPENEDDDEEEEEEEEEDEIGDKGATEEEGRKLLSELMRGMVEKELEELEKSDIEFEPPGGEDDEDEPMDLDNEEDSRYDGFGARVSQLVRQALPRDKNLHSSEELAQASQQITELFVALTSFTLSLIGASYLESVRSFPDGNILKSCRTVSQLVLRGGGKDEKLTKKEKLIYEEAEETREAREEEEEGWDSTKFEKNVEISTLMVMSIEFRIQAGATSVNFEPVGFFASPHHLRAFVTPENQDYLPKRIVELWDRQLEDTLAFNNLVQTKATTTLPDFELPEVDSQTPTSTRRAVKLINGLINSRQNKPLFVQSKTPGKVFFSALHDYAGLRPVEVPSDGPLATLKLTEHDITQLKQRSEALFNFFTIVGISNNAELELWEHEFWKYVIKPDVGDKKIYHGSVYVTREKISPLMFDLERFTKTGLAKLKTKVPQNLNARQTFETLISSNPKVVSLYLRIERRRLEHMKLTGQSEVVQLRGQRPVGTRTILGVNFTEILETVAEVVPLPPLLRAAEDATSSSTQDLVRHVLQFVKPLGGSTNLSPRLDDRKAITLSLIPQSSSSSSSSSSSFNLDQSDGQSKWRGWCAEHVETPVLSSTKSTPAVWAIGNVQGRPPRPRPPPPPIASTSTTTMSSAPSTVATASRRSLLSDDEPFSQSLNPRAVSFIPNSINNPSPSFSTATTTESAPSAFPESKSNWRSETSEWLERTRGSINSTVLVGIDRGRVYKTVEAVVRVGSPGKIEFYRKRSSDALINERRWNKTLEEVKAFEPRTRLAAMFFDPAAPTSDLSILTRRPSSIPQAVPVTTSPSSPTSQAWFSSQTSWIPSSLQGALLHSPDYISTSLNTVHQDQLQASIDSEAAKKWNRILPRPSDGSRIQVAVIRSTTKFSEIGKVKGHGRDDSRRYEDADVHAIRALPWTEVMEVECTEAHSSHICSSCHSTLIHPCRIGDPALSKILRQYVCIKCNKIINRDDNGALNIISIALGIAAVGKGNVLSPRTAELLNNLNYLTKIQSIRLENQFHRALSEKKEEDRKKFVEELSGRDYIEILGLTASQLAELEAEAELEGDEALE